MGLRGIGDDSSRSKRQGPKNYVGNCRHLQSSKRIHAVLEKLSDRKYYEA